MSTPHPNNLRLDYIEFATRDVAAARAFYSTAFGWQFTDYGPDYTSFTDGRLAGGFFAHPDAPTTNNPTVVIFASDLESAEQRVLAAGGHVVNPSHEFPGGRRFEFTDPTGLQLAVWSDVRVDGTRIP